METGATRVTPARLAVRVTTLALVAGAVVAVMAAMDGAGTCSAGTVSGGAASARCWDLVRMFSGRVGAAVAVATAVFTLTAVGLARTAAASQHPDANLAP